MSNIIKKALRNYTQKEKDLLSIVCGDFSEMIKFEVNGIKAYETVSDLKNSFDITLEMCKSRNGAKNSILVGLSKLGYKVDTTLTNPIEIAIEIENCKIIKPQNVIISEMHDLPYDSSMVYVKILAADGHGTILTSFMEKKIRVQRYD
jgi:hypothetical protein